jgi:hypothetical protein
MRIPAEMANSNSSTSSFMEEGLSRWSGLCVKWGMRVTQKAKTAVEEWVRMARSRQRRTVGVGQARLGTVERVTTLPMANTRSPALPNTLKVLFKLLDFFGMPQELPGTDVECASCACSCYATGKAEGSRR